MRVLHLIESLEFGGAEKIVISLANATAAAHEVAIGCVKRVGALAGEVDARIRVFSLGKGEGNDYGLPMRLASEMSAGRFDVVHTHNWGVFLEGGLGAVMARIPVRIHTVHGPYWTYADTMAARMKLALRHFMERRVASRFDRIVAVSDSIAEYIVGDIGVAPAKVCTVHNGIVVAPLTARTTSVEGVTTFLTVGRLAAIKNHALMLRAFRRARDAGAKARLVIAGDGPERAALEALVAGLALGSDVTFLGFRDDVTALLADADVFMLTSRYEGISVALLEAMRAGMPAIATRVGGIPESILDGDSGMLAGADDEAGISAAVVALANDAALRHRMGARARDFFLEEFSLERMTARYLDLYSAPAPRRPVMERPAP